MLTKLWFWAACVTVFVTSTSQVTVAQQNWTVAIPPPAAGADPSIYPQHFDNFARAINRLVDDITEVKIVNGPGQVDETLSGLKEGQFAVASVPLADLETLNPGFGIYREPVLSRGYDASLEMAQLAHHALSESLEPFDLKLLYTFPTQLRGLYSTEPLESLQSLEGRKFAPFSDISAAFAQSFGAELLSTPFREAFMEAQAAFASPYFGMTNKAFKHYRYFYDLQILPPIHAVLVGTRTFGELTEASQNAIEHLARVAELDIWSAVQRADEAHVRVLSENGIRVEAPTLPMKQELQEVAAAAEERIVSTLGERPISGAARRGFGVSERCALLEIFYGTDRMPDDDGASYRPGPARGELMTGTVRVVGPSVFRQSLAELVSCDNFSGRERCYGDVAKRHCLIWKDRMSRDEFVDRLGGEEAGPFIFVHGFRTQIDEALKGVHRLYQGLGASWAPILFSWPTMETALRSVLAYPGDRETALESSNDLRELIDTVTSARNENDVSVIAHSMGTFVLVEALKELAEDGDRETLGPREVILLAPDMSEDEFLKRTLPDFKASVGRVSVYSSRNDCVLALSRDVMHKPRVGLTPPQVVDPAIDSIDVSDANNDLKGWGHSYHLVSPEVLRDLGDVLHGKELKGRVNLSSGSGNGTRALVYKLEGGPYLEAGILQECVGGG